MKKLLDAGLIGKGLIMINQPALVSRYNSCLKAIGKEPTNLSVFMIDGQGWSPEIAKEKQDRMYLSNGEANQYAFILTPEQRGQPNYFPFHSFTRPLLEAFWKNFNKEIGDITTTSALILDLNQGLSHYTSPLDLMVVDSISLAAFTNDGLQDGAKEQGKLIETFYDDHNWFDEKLRKQIIDSATKYGDLRQRHVLLSPFQYDAVKTFYTMAFGGVYILRHKGKTGEPLIVLSSEQAAKDLGQPSDNVFWINDPTLLDYLFKYQLISLDPKYYLAYPFRLPAKLDSIFIETLSVHRPEVNPLELTSGQKEYYVNELRGHLPPIFFQLERLELQLQRHGNYNSEDMADALRLSILYPPRSLPQIVRDVVWQLLIEIVEQDIFTLYVYNKARFLDRYRSWSSNRQSWAVDVLTRNYHARKEARKQNTK